MISKNFNLKLKRNIFSGVNFEKVYYNGTYKNKYKVDIFFIKGPKDLVFTTVSSKKFTTNSKYENYQIETVERRIEMHEELLFILNNKKENNMCQWSKKKILQINEKLPAYNTKFPDHPS
jgi:hypothetical protein